MTMETKLADCEAKLFEMERRLCWIYPHAVNRGALADEERRTAKVISDCIDLAGDYRARYYTGQADSATAVRTAEHPSDD